MSEPDPDDIERNTEIIKDDLAIGMVQKLHASLSRAHKENMRLEAVVKRLRKERGDATIEHCEALLMILDLRDHITTLTGILRELGYEYHPASGVATPVEVTSKQ